MKELINKFEKKKVIAIISFLAIGLLCAIIIGYNIYAADQKKQHILNSLNIEFVDSTVVEYGTKDFNSKLLIKSNTGTLESLPKLDTLKLGKQSLTYIVSQDGQIRKFKKEIEIKDSKKPEITIKSDEIKLTVGDAFDATKNIASVKDPVDGDLTFIKMEDVKKDQVSYYTVKNEVDIKKVGTYKVTCFAFDKNGNKAEKKFNVVVSEEDEQKEPQKSPTQQDPINNSNGGTGTSTTTPPSTNNVSKPKPTPPIPEKPTECIFDGTYKNEIGNTGMIFANFEEAKNWAEVNAKDGFASSVTAIWDNCGKIKYTVSFDKGIR